jgi:A/G-specific adenine glycosylase
MLGGMRALPDDGWSARGDGSGAAPLPGSWRAGGLVRHGFTHFDLELGLAIYAGDRWSELAGEGEWWPVAEIEEAGLPTLFAKAARLALA